MIVLLFQNVRKDFIDLKDYENINYHISYKYNTDRSERLKKQ
jgi:hypothetical protein